MNNLTKQHHGEVDVSNLSASQKTQFLTVLQEKCKDKLFELVKVFRDEFNITIPEPKIVFNLRSRTIAGQAVYPTTIRFSNTFLLNEQQHYIDNIVGHELAHFIIFHMQERGILPNNIRAHGVEWQKIMTLFNIKPDIYHTYKLEPRKHRKGSKVFVYSCGCQEVEIEEAKHKRIAKGTLMIRCRTCKKPLQLQRSFVAE